MVFCFTLQAQQILETGTPLKETSELSSNHILKQLLVLELDSVINEKYNSQTDDLDYVSKRILANVGTGNQKDEIFYQWQSADKLWKKTGKWERDFDVNGYQTLFAEHTWDESNKKWINNNRKEWKYDSQGNILIFTYYSRWNPSTKQWGENFKREFAYDSNGNQILDIRSNYDTESNSWKAQVKLEQTFDARGNQLSRCHYFWDSAKSSWKGVSKNQYEFDEQNNQTLRVEFNWSTSENNWVYYRKWVDEYKPSGDHKIERISYWNAGSNLWKEEFRTESVYSDNGRLTSVLHYRLDDNDLWFQYQKQEYIEDNSNNHISEITSRRISPEQNMRKITKVIRSYDTMGNLTFQNYYKWNSTSNQWEEDDLYRKTESRFDNNGNRIMYASYSWDNDRQKYVGNFKRIVNYDDFGNAILKIFYKWDSVNDQWLKDQKDDIEYIDGNLIKSFKTNHWNTSVNNWSFTKQTTYYYSDSQSTSSKSADDLFRAINIYPNPASDVIYIDINQNPMFTHVEIYDLNGNLSLYQKLSQSNQIRVDHLSRGVYIMKLQQDGASLIRKIILK